MKITSSNMIRSVPMNTPTTIPAIAPTDNPVDIKIVASLAIKPAFK